jgi:fructose-1-phosphate kinase PfkB-like protein
MTDRPTAAQLLERPGSLLTRSHLRDLGLGRSAIDAVFKELDVVVFPGSSRPHVRRDDYVELVERSTYAEGRVRLRSS